MRLKNNLNIKELSEKSNISFDTISKIEHNKTNCTLSTLKKLSIVLNTSIAYLANFYNLPETTFGERLRKARHFHGHTIPECAKVLNVFTRTIYAWESDECYPNEKNRPLVDEYLEILKDEIKPSL